MWKKLKKKVKGVAGKCVEANDILHNAMDSKYIEDKFYAVDEKRMKELNRERLISIAHGFTREDWEIIIGEAPIDICHNRIGKELKEAADYRKQTRELFKLFNGTNV